MSTKTFKEQLVEIRNSLVSNNIKPEEKNIKEIIINEDKLQEKKQDIGEWVICEQCDKEIKKKNLKRHIKSYHTEKNQKLEKTNIKLYDLTKQKTKIT